MIKNIFLIFVLSLLVAFLLFYGESGFSLDTSIILQLRLPKIISCVAIGALLANSGMLMQLFFQNPLAGPDILGVSSGASLFVAIWIMASQRLPDLVVNWGMNVMSFLGSLLVFLLLLVFVRNQFSKMSLIIIGILLSSFTSSCITMLFNMSNSLQVKNFLLWGSGSFRNLTIEQAPTLVILSVLSLVPVIIFNKSLNQFMLSENYARSVGVNIKMTKIIFISIAAFQVSLVTLYCGPIGFIGIIAPHMARFFTKQSQLKNLLPATLIMGAMFAIFTEVILVVFPALNLTVNSILGFVGAPLILFIFLSKRELAS